MLDRFRIWQALAGRFSPHEFQSQEQLLRYSDWFHRIRTNCSRDFITNYALRSSTSVLVRGHRGRNKALCLVSVSHSAVQVSFHELVWGPSTLCSDILLKLIRRVKRTRNSTSPKASGWRIAEGRRWNYDYPESLGGNWLQQFLRTLRRFLRLPEGPTKHLLNTAESRHIANCSEGPGSPLLYGTLRFITLPIVRNPVKLSSQVRIPILNRVLAMPVRYVLSQFLGRT